METYDLRSFRFRWTVPFTQCLGPTPLTARLVDEWEDESDDDRHEHEEPEIRIHTVIVREFTDGQQRHPPRLPAHQSSL